jgi:1-acyl-sn-glycerol-3-phosphate acyltransferase
MATMSREARQHLGETAPQESAGLLRECRALYDGWVAFAASRKGLLLMFCWAIAEALFWPLIPDFLLVPLMAANRKRPHLPVLVAIAGMALGGSILYLAAFVAPSTMLAYLSHLPLVSSSQVVEAHNRLVQEGVASFFAQPCSGIPFKVWGVAGAVLGISPLQAIPIFIVARSIRMCIFATVARLLGGWFRSFLRDYSLFVALIYVVLFFLGWWQVSG